MPTTTWPGVTRQSSESSFDYLQSIPRILDEPCAVSTRNPPAPIGPVDARSAGSRNYIIGRSAFTAENGVERDCMSVTIGALTVLARGVGKRTPERRIRPAPPRRPNAAFLPAKRPWLSLSVRPGADQILEGKRRCERLETRSGRWKRRIALTLEYAGKAVCTLRPIGLARRLFACGPHDHERLSTGPRRYGFLAADKPHQEGRRPGWRICADRDTAISGIQPRSYAASEARGRNTSEDRRQPENPRDRVDDLAGFRRSNRIQARYSPFRCSPGPDWRRIRPLDVEVASTDADDCRRGNARRPCSRHAYDY